MKKRNVLLLLAILFSINVYAEDLETEPNNKMAEANPITPGVALTGDITSIPDDDWFFFETTAEDVLTITLVDSGVKPISVYDIDQNLLYNKVLELEPSAKIGLGKAGKFFVQVGGGGGYVGPYKLTVNLENKPPFNSPTTCTGNPTFSSNTGILEIPAVDVSDTLGDVVTYKASMKLIPSEKILFEVTEALPK